MVFHWALRFRLSGATTLLPNVSPQQPMTARHMLGHAVVVSVLLAGCGGGAARPAATRSASLSPTPTTSSSGSAPATPTATAPTPPRPGVAHPRPRPATPSYPRLLSSALSSAATGFVPVSSWRGQTAAWISRSPAGVALLALNQRLLALHLHSGTTDAGATGWRFGPEVAASEIRHLVGAFNGGFKFSTGSGGFLSYGRVGAPLRIGAGSVVTYADGRTDIGTWGSEVPARGRQLTSVRQNLPLLIDGGSAASNPGCLSCWGSTITGNVAPARSGLGITADGTLIWAAGEHLTVAALADALLGAHVVRAVQLDINPFWVAGYLYGHRGGAGPLAPVPVVPGQNGISGQYLAPWSRDFFTIVTR